MTKGTNRTVPVARALNRNMILFWAAGLLCAGISYAAFVEKEIGVGLGFGIFAALLIVAPMVGMPWCYCFDPKGVSLKYIFLSEERYLWKNIHSVCVVQAISDNGRKSLFMRDLQISGNVEGKQRRYMDGRLCKNRRTKRLIEKYWDGTIEGYWHDEVQAVKKWWNKRSKNKQKQRLQHLTDEIVIMEREARASFRTWLEPFAAEAAQYDLEVQTQYLYITEDYEEHRSRPQTAHTYTAVTNICRPKETNEDRIIVLETELLRVRLGKNAYRGVVNLQAEEELKGAFTEVMKEIKANGFEAYIKEVSC